MNILHPLKANGFLLQLDESLQQFYGKELSQFEIELHVEVESDTGQFLDITQLESLLEYSRLVETLMFFCRKQLIANQYFPDNLC